MPPKNPLLQKCIAYFESLPNIKATILGEYYFSSEVLADGELTISTSDNTINYVCEIKTDLTNDVVEQVADYMTHLGGRLKHGQRPLLVTRSLSNLVVDQLLERNIEFIDVNGNIYLNSPGIYLVVRNQDSKDSTNKSLEITSAGLQVMYALLSQPNIVNGYNDDKRIADISGVTAKTVKSTLKKLQELDYITEKHGRYKIINYVKLLERWELGYFERLRAKLLIGRFSPIGKRNFSEIEDELKKYADQYSYLIGGELAASILTEYLRPISATLHIDKNVNHRQIGVQLKLKPDPEGNIALLESFGYAKYYQNQNELGKKKNIVHPLLIHAELVHTGNSRLKETAQLIYDRYIEEIAQKNDWF